MSESDGVKRNISECDISWKNSPASRKLFSGRTEIVQASGLTLVTFLEIDALHSFFDGDAKENIKQLAEQKSPQTSLLELWVGSGKKKKPLLPSTDNSPTKNILKNGKIAKVIEEDDEDELFKSLEAMDSSLFDVETDELSDNSKTANVEKTVTDNNVFLLDTETKELESILEAGLLSDSDFNETMAYFSLIVLNLHIESNPILCKVLNCKDGKGNFVKLILKQDWFECHVLAGDSVNAVGEFPGKSEYILDNKSDAYLVVLPHIMLTGTNLSDSFSCLRRSVLSTKLQRFDAQKGSSAMLQGTIIHEIFQQTLVDGKFNLNEKLQKLIKSYLPDILATTDSEDQIEKSIQNSFTNIMKWFKEQRSSFEVVDIEDCIRSNIYGLKGKIDATFSVKSDNSVIVPFELKTGKRTGNTSHRAQTTIYSILLSEKYNRTINYGLLYYLFSNEQIKVPSLKNETRGILLKRNEFVRFLSKKNEEFILPSMIDNEFICSRCFQVDNCYKFQKILKESGGFAKLTELYTNELDDQGWQFISKLIKFLHKEEMAAEDDEGYFGTLYSNVLRLAGNRRLLDIFVNVIDKRKVVEEKKPAEMSISHDSFNSLNSDQKAVIIKALNLTDHLVVLGMPGTGKSLTISVLIQILAEQGKRVLLAGFTNNSIDNILLKLPPEFAFLRVGNIERIHPKVRCKSASNIPNEIRTVLQLDNYYKSVKVIATTCLSMNHSIFVDNHFDICIIDEASQISIPAIISPLLMADKFILVGDHFQLSPLTKSTFAKESGMSKSLFEFMIEADPASVSKLSIQYRMNQSIMQLSNTLVYNNSLTCGSSCIAKAQLKMLYKTTDIGWLNECLNPEMAVVFLDTDNICATQECHQKSLLNRKEAEIVQTVALNLMAQNVDARDIGVISPYKSQTMAIRDLMNNSDVEVSTIDSFQGRDKECIIISFVKSIKGQNDTSSEFMNDSQRINVALTRAKTKLIMIGSKSTLVQYPMMSSLISMLNSQIISIV